MILPFMDKFPDGTPTNFDTLIEKEIKKHTFREDLKERWDISRKIHMAYHNRTKQMKVFRHEICKGIQRVEMYYSPTMQGAPVSLHDFVIKIDGKIIPTIEEIAIIIRNDGLSVVRFAEHFFNNEPGKKWVGKIIHWTNLKY